MLLVVADNDAAAKSDTSLLPIYKIPPMPMSALAEKILIPRQRLP